VIAEADLRSRVARLSVEQKVRLLTGAAVAHRLQRL